MQTHIVKLCSIVESVFSLTSECGKYVQCCTMSAATLRWMFACTSYYSSRYEVSLGSRHEIVNHNLHLLFETSLHTNP